VFFAGSIGPRTEAGSVAEFPVRLGASDAVSILVPTSLADRLAESSGPVGIVGWIVDAPAENVNGYTGDAPQAIWVSRVLALR
jgi:hypothetical protein